MPCSTRHLKILSFNANSLLGHMDQIRAAVVKGVYHVVVVSETWLHSNILDELVQIENYCLIRNELAR